MIEYVEALMADTWEPMAPRVNEPFPWVSGNGMLPTVLELLPDLPPDIEYRFVGADLVLIDLRSELVVDILRDALPTPTLSYERRADGRERTFSCTSAAP